MNGNFGLALITAAFGSFFGAYGAQWIAERQATKRGRLEQLRATNAATSLAVFTVNALIAGRRQHLIGMLKKFRDQRQELLAALELAAQQNTPVTFTFTADWQTFPWTEVPTAELRALVFDRIDQPRAINLVNMLNSTVTHLRSTLAQRDEMAMQMVERSNIPPNELAQMYFGVPAPGNRSDSRHKDMLDGAESYSENAILFGAVLINILIKHGKKTSQRLGKAAPHVVQADFGSAIDQGLVADPADYAEVLQNMGIDPGTALSLLRPLTGNKEAPLSPRGGLWRAVSRVRRPRPRHDRRSGPDHLP